MADQAFLRETRTQGEIVSRVFIEGEEAEFVFGRGTQIFPNAPVEIWGTTSARIVDDAGERWFEMGFRMDHELSGNPAAGWTDQGDYFRIDYQWSTDLVTWNAGKFVPAPVPVTDLGGGMYEYWARAIHPQDAAVKTAEIRVSSGYAGGVGNTTADSRNNPFTGLTVDSVALALGGFPYTMPGDAARMQTDLRAFYPAATVESSAATTWRIIIPDVTTSAFNTTSKVHWASYQSGTDPLGGAVYSDGAPLVGNYVDADGVAVHPRAFGRLKFTAGSRYNPYL